MGIIRGPEQRATGYQPPPSSGLTPPNLGDIARNIAADRLNPVLHTAVPVAHHEPRIGKGVKRGLRVAIAGVAALVATNMVDLRPAQAQPLSPFHKIELKISPDSAVGVEGGMFYNETNGGAPEDMGYFVRGAMWTAYQSLGREGTWGPPVSRQYADEVGRVSQAFQRGIFQLTLGPGGAVQSVEFDNVFDKLSSLGKDGWLESERSTPRSADWSSDAGKSWDEVVANHLAVLDGNPAIKRKFFENSDWLNQYGLPMAIADFGNVIVVRCQRAGIQLWTVPVPWAVAGQPIVALGGDEAKKAGGIIPSPALVLERLSNVSGQGGGGEIQPPQRFEFNLNEIKTGSVSPEKKAQVKTWIQDVLIAMENDGDPTLAECLAVIKRREFPWFLNVNAATYNLPFAGVVTADSNKSYFGTEAELDRIQPLLGRPIDVPSKVAICVAVWTAQGLKEIAANRNYQGRQAYENLSSSDSDVKKLAQKVGSDATALDGRLRKPH